ncbi:hypothetical protein CCACVL1_01620, partial [Corchorus capsularis]
LVQAAISLEDLKQPSAKKTFDNTISERSHRY